MSTNWNPRVGVTSEWPNLTFPLRGDNTIYSIVPTKSEINNGNGLNQIIAEIKRLMNVWGLSSPPSYIAQNVKEGKHGLQTHIDTIRTRLGLSTYSFSYSTSVVKRDYPTQLRQALDECVLELTGPWFATYASGLLQSADCNNWVSLFNIPTGYVFFDSEILFISINTLTISCCYRYEVGTGIFVDNISDYITQYRTIINWPYNYKTQNIRIKKINDLYVLDFPLTGYSYISSYQYYSLDLINWIPIICSGVDAFVYSASIFQDSNGRIWCGAYYKYLGISPWYEIGAVYTDDNFETLQIVKICNYGTPPIIFEPSIFNNFYELDGYIYIICGNSVYKSSDGGLNWSVAGTPNTTYHGCMIGLPNSVYNSDTGYKTVDGINFVSLNLPVGAAIPFVVGNRLYSWTYTTTTITVIYSDDEGDTWQTLTIINSSAGSSFKLLHLNTRWK